MIKKQYFNILWGLSSITIVLQAIAVLLLGAVQIFEADPAEIRMSAAVLMLIIGGMMSILVYGFIITMNLHFSQKVGVRLLFLNGQVDFKKIVNNISASSVILASVFLYSLLPGFHVVWKHGIAMSAIVPSVEAIGQAMLLGLLFWKKGFEAAVFCHLIIAFILYLVIPGVIFALGF